MRTFVFVAAPAMGISLNFRRKGDPEPWACYHGDAETYRGTVAVATTGQKCMLWKDAADAEKGEFSSASYGADTKGEKPGDKTAGNFCRAFGNDAKPWCYVQGASAADNVKQDCDVPACPSDGPWSRNFNDDAKSGAIDCADEVGGGKTGAPNKECDCSCDGVGGTAFLQKTANGWVCNCRK